MKKDIYKIVNIIRSHKFRIGDNKNGFKTLEVVFNNFLEDIIQTISKEYNMQIRPQKECNKIPKYRKHENERNNK